MSIPTQQYFKRAHLTEVLEIYPMQEKCEKHQLMDKASRMFLNVYEWPLPSDENETDVVLFEIRIPTIISQLRDALYLFKKKVTKITYHVQNTIHKIWRDYDPLKVYSTNKSIYFSLGSDTKSFTNSHYNSIHVNNRIDMFIPNNGLKIKLTDIKDFKQIKYNEDHNKIKELYFKVEKPYNQLKFAVDSTYHSENEVIAELANLPKSLSAIEFIKFGTLRSGHFLQMTNLLDVLETRTISFNNASVVSLISHCLWQIGPIDQNHEILDEIPSSHKDFERNDYTNILHDMVERFLKDITKKWNDHLILYNLIIIILRSVSLSKSNKKMITLLRKCREISTNWERNLKELAKTNENRYSKQLAIVCCYTILTYDVEKREICNLLESTDDLVIWLNSMNTINEFKRLYKNKKEDDYFMDNLLRRIEITSIEVAEQYNSSIKNNNGTALTKFTELIWSDPNGKFISGWKISSIIYPYWYTCKIRETDQDTNLAININGEFLVNNCPLGKLPSNIIEHKYFKEFFGATNFNVSSNKNGSFETNFKIKDDCTLSYVFNHLLPNQLNISETYKCKKSQFIPREIFDDIIPNKLIYDFSHWYVEDENVIEFRPNKFDNQYHESVKKNKPKYVFNLQSNKLYEFSSKKCLVSITSSTFSQIYDEFAVYLELKEYVHVFVNDNCKNRFNIEFPRLKLKFEIDCSKREILSTDFLNFKVPLNQNFNTMIGLNKCLVIEENEIYPVRKIIVPHGSIEIATACSSFEKIITINMDEEKKDPYFCYTIDETLRRLKADDSNTAWLYLACLHAYTSHIMPDPFTDLTGTEMALYLLQSAVCWSCKPLCEESQYILRNIIELSPKRKYYPENLKILQNVKWPKGMPSLCAHESFQFICQKILDDSYSFQFEKQSFDTNSSKLLLANKAYNRVSRFYRNTECVKSLFNKSFSPLLPLRENASTSNDQIINNIRLLQIDRKFPSRCLSIEYLNKNGIEKLHWKKANEMRKSQGFRISTFLEAKCLNTLQYNTFMQYFVDNWLELFKFSIKLSQNKEFEDKIKLNFILSYFAHKGIDVEYLLFFKIICSMNFPWMFHEIEKYENDYDTSLGWNFDSNMVSQCVNKNYIVLTEYNRIRRLPHQENKTGFNYKKTIDCTKICDIILKFGLNFKFEMLNLSQIISEANIKFDLIEFPKIIKNMFETWNNNKMLASFISQIQTIINPLNNYTEFIPLCKLKSSTKSIEKESNLLFFNSSEIKQFKITYKDIIINFKIAPNLFTSSNKKQKLEFPLAIEKECDEHSHEYYEYLKRSWIHFQNQKHKKLDCASDFLKKYLQNLEKYYTNEIFNYLDLLKVFMYSKICIVTNCLYKSGLCPTMSPMVIFRHLITDPDQNLKFDIKMYRNILTIIGVLFCIKNQIVRCIKYASKKEMMQNSLEKELLNKPFENWSPKTNPEWLILQLELDITIRNNQINVAKQMLTPPDYRNTLIQMNMGEGKTAVIIPLLIATLTKQEYLVRLIVLKSLIDINYTALVFKIGNLLNKKIYILPFNREFDTKIENLEIYFSILKECYDNKNVLLTLSEYCLSFNLKVIEMCQNNKYEDETKKLKEIQNWIEKVSRDILDESDEILSSKYQLVYSVGMHSELDGEKLRWLVFKDVLKLTRSILKSIQKRFQNSIEYQDSSSNEYPTIRLFDKSPLEILKRSICYYFLNRKGIEVKFRELKSKEIKFLRRFILLKNVDHTLKNKVQYIISQNSGLMKILLILRGLLSYDILYSILEKRWKVEYGVNHNNKRLLQAVPYRAKDVPAERAQFAHPDIAIGLTFLSYYYSGLEQNHLDDVINSLTRNPNGAHIYNMWMKNLSGTIDESIKKLSNINLLDGNQMKSLYLALKKYTAVIDFWLENFLFPKEACEFKKKLSASSWDLVSLDKNLTGFSGTNDSRFLLPLRVKYYELPELTSTTGSVISSIIKQESDCLKELSTNKELEKEVLKTISLNLNPKISVLIDVGALMIRLTNKEVALKWLEFNKETKAAVYFEDNKLVALEQDFDQPINFETSIYKQNLNDCIIYLDEFHTRGTDLSMPKNTTAAVTLSKGLTKDRLFQACMRMRMLGNGGHHVIFFATSEVYNTIPKELGVPPQINVLNWCIQNSIKQIKHESFNWASQGLCYYHKESAKKNFKNNPDFFKNCIELCLNELESMYASDRRETFVCEIIERNRSKKNFISNDEMFLESAEIVERLKKIVPDLKRYDQILDGEMEKEFELEVEAEREIEIETEVERPRVKPCINVFDKEIEDFIRYGTFNKESKSFVIMMKSLENSSVSKLVDEFGWSKKIYTTKDFLKTVETFDFDDKYLRPPRWVAFNKQNRIFLIISGHEANKFFQHFNSNCELLLIMPRNRQEQLGFISLQNFSSLEANKYEFKNLLQILCFSGSYYFKSLEEQSAFLSFVGYCVKERTPDQQKYFDQNLINKNSYVPKENRERVFGEQYLCRFNNDPSNFITKLISIRNYGIVPDSAHHYEIFLNGKKPL